ncbi:MAG: hypothetical protein FWC06_08170 [Treponema sp.]|nr:hypothetical protein [Treponema sp.]
MKRCLFLLLLGCLLCSGIFSQSIYVSASGNDSNDGLSEGRAVRSLGTAVDKAYAINGKVVVVGTLNAQSESYNGVYNKWSYGAVFRIANIERELTIAGKPNAAGRERAVISTADSDAMVLSADNSRIRFENIEISGGDGEFGMGIEIINGASITLGQGAVVSSNALFGVFIHDGTCIIDGGAVMDNKNSGVVVYEKGSLILRDGYIRNNLSHDNGGGVAVINRGSFTMTGGVISGNSAPASGGGVFVYTGGRFDQTGGIISGNTAYQGSNPNVYRAQGTLGTNP